MDKFFVISDLHSKKGGKSFGGFHEHGIDDFTVPTDTEVIIVAGDIVHPELVFEKLAQYQVPVVVVAGNHDYWKREITDGIDYLVKLAAPYEQIHVLENSVIELGGIRFIGATLWPDFGNWHPRLVIESNEYHLDNAYIKANKWWQLRKNQVYAEKLLRQLVEQSQHNHVLRGSLPDVSEWIATLVERGRFHPVIAYQLHQQSIDFIISEVAKPYKGKTVVVSHHPPTGEALRITRDIEELDLDAWNNYRFVPSCADRFSMDPFNPELAGNYAAQHEEKFMKKGGYLYRQKVQDWYGEGTLRDIDLWVHGHVHAHLEYGFQGVRFIVNALKSFQYDNEAPVVSLEHGLRYTLQRSVDKAVKQLQDAVNGFREWQYCDEIERIESIEIKNAILAQLKLCWRDGIEAAEDFRREFERITSIRIRLHGDIDVLPEFDKYRFERIIQWDLDSGFVTRGDEDELSRDKVSAAIAVLEHIKRHLETYGWMREPEGWESTKQELTLSLERRDLEFRSTRLLDGCVLYNWQLLDLEGKQLISGQDARDGRSVKPVPISVYDSKTGVGKTLGGDFFRTISGSARHQALSL